ncbi:hypothetical protein D9758_003551 [Tetrapyrgos nigripes]|uniref:Flavin-containing monooxygenase n=1 Tax=Tetrapyrgos nigripes TaxID=182062 RepID=A0A8H5GUS9_9AGAR|nr:hypothetical protein D9758_003551 [Tetrapyrgos nigripes]
MAINPEPRGEDLPTGGFPLPTLDHLGIETEQIPTDPTEARRIAEKWFAEFSSAVDASSTASTSPSGGTSIKSNVNTGVDTIVTSLFHTECYWRDILALTWDFRSFTGPSQIRQFLTDRLEQAKLGNLNLQSPEYISVQFPYPDIAWIQFMFSFRIGDVGIGSGIGRLIPVPVYITGPIPSNTVNGSDLDSSASESTSNSNKNMNIEWKCHCLFTHLEDLQSFPEKIGALRNRQLAHGLGGSSWIAQRRREIEFVDEDPKVVVVGGSQSGLTVGARLKMLEVPTLIVDKLPRIGDNWRKRYEALCLHDPVYNDHLPYMPFPPNWPEYAPAAKLAGWLEAYAEFMELSCWTSSTVTKAHYLEDKGTWEVHIRREREKPNNSDSSNLDSEWVGIDERGQRILDYEERVFHNVKHVIFATGFGAGEPDSPDIAGMDKFKGQILHSVQHRSASDHLGKKIAVIGSCTSGHDIAADCVYNGVDVTMVQRGPTYVMTVRNGYKVMGGLFSEGGPPTDIADRIQASFPFFIGMNGMLQRRTKEIEELDRELLENLMKVGFKLTSGPEGTGFALRAAKKVGGYYFDVGASQLIIDGKIKLKNDSLIERFTEDGILFENGSKLEADVIIFATGYADFRTSIRRICDPVSAQKCRRIWGIDPEGELRGVYRNLGVPGLWYMTGGLGQCRFHSKHLALQIKAMEEGLLEKRYELKVEDPTK